MVNIHGQGELAGEFLEKQFFLERKREMRRRP
jgi:hypothetical protein